MLILRSNVGNSDVNDLFSSYDFLEKSIVVAFQKWKQESHVRPKCFDLIG